MQIKDTRYVLRDADTEIVETKTLKMGGGPYRHRGNGAEDKRSAVASVLEDKRFMGKCLCGQQ